MVKGLTKADMMTGNMAAAWGARLADVDYVAAYPITPQTEIVEVLAKWIAEGVMDAKFVNFESEHSMLAAAGAASLTGARPFSATSSQGLVYAMEMLYAVAGWRAPMVLVNVARGLGMPMTLQVEHSDVLSARDTGFIQIHAENCQEVLDSILIAYRVAEDERVMLPAIVNLDGFFLSFTREPVTLPDYEEVKRFLPPYKPRHGIAFAEGTVVHGPTILEGHVYSYFKYQQYLASMKAKDVFHEAAEDFGRLFRRHYGPVEPYMLEGADYAIVCSNSYTAIIREAIRKLRSNGIRVGLLKLRLIRPFPREEVANSLRGLRGVAVFDQNIAHGRGGILYPEVVEALYHEDDGPRAITSFIGGLGGKHLSFAEIKYMVEVTKRAASGERLPRPILLYTKGDLEGLINSQEIAGKAAARPKEAT